MVGIDDTVFPESPAVLMKELDKYFVHLMTNGAG